MSTLRGNKIAGVKEAAGPVDKIDHLLPGGNGLRTDVLKAPLAALNPRVA